ncbi:cyclase family protein [Desulfosediminicola flagellatus]|uniref:cyclase family protein n=1 Tax=Desulfosediminicola flagellatus TaxID=2569541 RepID=UPI0010ACB05F|nr:cyclase family protein [Desulfosediminicola flagellatus]
MRSIDLTHRLEPAMPVFPGTEQPGIEQANTLEDDGFREKKVCMYSHTGTHIDAPAHMDENGKTLDAYPVEWFHGPACVYFHPDEHRKTITVDLLEPLQSYLKTADFLLLATGWDKYWATPEYFGDFPVLDEKAAKWLTQFSLKGIGLDVMSADMMKSKDFSIHRILFAKELLIVENLKNLSNIPTPLCEFFCLPLNLADADGAPVRALAIVD